MSEPTPSGLVANVYEIKVLPNTASQLVEAIFKQKDLSRAEAREMAAELDERYKMSDYVPTSPPNQDTEVDRILDGVHLTGANLGSPDEVTIEEAKSALNQYYKSIILEVIGADEPQHSAVFPMPKSDNPINKYKAELRQRLESRLG